MHWKKHPNIYRFPGKKKNVIYNPKEFVKLIVHGTSPVPNEVARSALLKAKERIKALGKEKVGANLLGRKLDIDI